MSPTHKEKMRWVFAGQAMQGFISHNPFNEVLQWDYKMCVDHANDLIAELEKTAPKEECPHTDRLRVGVGGGAESCNQCGKVFDR